MANYPPPGSLRGLAQDLIAQIRGGHPQTDDEPIKEVQLIEWLRRAASTLFRQTVKEAEANDNPIDERWYQPLVLDLVHAPLDDTAIRFARATLTGVPLTMAGVDLMRDYRLEDEAGTPVQIVTSLGALAAVSQGWGRIKKPRPALWKSKFSFLVALPEFCWEAEKLYLNWAPSDPLFGVGVNEALDLPPGWTDAMMEAVTKGPLYVMMRGIPDVINDATDPAAKPQAQ